MQTFLPYADFCLTAQCLDFRRLGKQRVEAKQILLALDRPDSGWSRHPATLMWKGYERALALYGLTMCAQWVARGYGDNLLHWFAERVPADHYTAMPPWWGDGRLHSSHRSNLLRKDPQHYHQFGWRENAEMPYFWPTKEGYSVAA